VGGACDVSRRPVQEVAQGKFQADLRGCPMDRHPLFCLQALGGTGQFCRFGEGGIHVGQIGSSGTTWMYRTMPWRSTMMIERARNVRFSMSSPVACPKPLSCSPTGTAGSPGVPPWRNASGKRRVAADDDAPDGCGQLASLFAQVVGLLLAYRRVRGNHDAEKQDAPSLF